MRPLEAARVCPNVDGTKGDLYWQIDLYTWMLQGCKQLTEVALGDPGGVTRLGLCLAPKAIHCIEVANFRASHPFLRKFALGSQVILPTSFPTPPCPASTPAPRGPAPLLLLLSRFKPLPLTHVEHMVPLLHVSFFLLNLLLWVQHPGLFLLSLPAQVRACVCAAPALHSDAASCNGSRTTGMCP